MKKTVLILLVSTALMAGGCRIDGDNNCIPKTVASEQSSMEALASSQGMINYAQHQTGLLYTIIQVGTGVTPSSTSKIFVRYTGKLANGTVFDSQTNHLETGFILGGMINGWQIALPLIQEGGRIQIVLPSSLAYGCGFRGTIPSNSILYFDIELVDVQ